MTVIAAQVSLYPLRKNSLGQKIVEALQIFREHGLEVVPGPMSSRIAGDNTIVFAALQKAFNHTAENSEVVMVTTISNACPLPVKENEEGCL